MQAVILKLAELGCVKRARKPRTGRPTQVNSTLKVDHFLAPEDSMIRNNCFELAQAGCLSMSVIGGSQDG